MSMTDNGRVSVVQETEYGLYVWITEDGKVVADDEGNYMCITSKDGDLRKVRMLADAAKHYGVEGGKPLFLPGRRMVTDEEYEHQKFRLEMGLTPDPYDAPALRDELRNNGAS